MAPCGGANRFTRRVYLRAVFACLVSSDSFRQNLSGLLYGARRADGPINIDMIYVDLLLLLLQGLLSIVHPLRNAEHE